MRVLVKSPMHPYTGYGNDGIGIVLALLGAGLDVYLDPTNVSPPLPPPVAALLTKRLEPPFDLLIHHVDPGQLGIGKSTREAAALTVAWTMWEYTSLDNLKGRSTLRRKLHDYDLVFGYDPVSVGALLPYTNHPSGAINALQGGFWPGQWPRMQRDWHSERFGFFMEGQLHQRKDPFVAIQAFQELKEEHPDFEHAELHLKTTVPGLHSAMEHWIPKLRVHYATWSEEVLHEFYGAQHCLISPSRGEGKNLPALQFMSTGGTVIATNWGGHTQWLHDAYAYPLDFTLAPIDPRHPNCLNARASKAHLKELMLHVYRNRGEAQQKGERAARIIPQMCSWDAVIARLFDKLAHHAPSGEQLSESMRRSAYLMRAGEGHD